MKQIVLMTLLLFTSGLMAEEGTIACHTPSLSKVFKLQNNKITFLEERQLQGRKVASLFVSRNKRSGKGFTKVVNFEGNKHTIHIEDQSYFSELDDYLVIRNSKGHEMTYSLSCSRS